jgi:glycosyltransferase involved in cell wall biosynthesis
LYVDGHLWSSGKLGYPRADVVAAIGAGTTENCGWQLTLNPPEDVSRTYHLTVEAMSADGRVAVLGEGELRLTDDAVTRARFEPPPIRVHLDNPESGTETSDETVRVAGWVDLGDEALDKVSIEVNGIEVGTARCFLPRPDVAVATGDPRQCFVGFEFYWARDPYLAEIELTATAITCFGVRTRSSASVLRLLPLLPAEDTPTLGLPSRGELRINGRAQASRMQRGDERLRVLVATHSLALGGGQLWLAEVLDYFSQDRDVTFSVISTDDGPLRADLEDAGVPVHLTDPLASGDAARYECRVQELERVLDRQDYDVVLCNTIGTFFIADAAQRLGVPTVFAIHEHFQLSEWWPYRNSQIQGSYAFRCLVETLSAASEIVFESQATRQLYADMLGRDVGTTIYYGVSTGAIDKYQSENSKQKARRELGIQADSTVILNIGTFEPRKAQAAIIEVFERVAARHNELVLLLLGSRTDHYSIAIENLLNTRDPAAPTIVTIPVTRDIWPYYHAADLLISASDIESMPRSFIEAMAFHTPIVTTDVAGCKELVYDAVSGWTCPPRTTIGLEIALERALASREAWADYARAGRLLLDRRHSSSTHSARLLELLRRTARTPRMEAVSRSVR